MRRRRGRAALAIAAAAIGLGLGPAAPAQAGTVTFDFEEFPESEACDAYTALPMARDGLTATVTRVGGASFGLQDLSGSVATHGVPADWGARSVCPSSALDNPNDFIVDFSQGVEAVSVETGDFGGADQDVVTLEAFAGPAATGALLDSSTVTLPRGRSSAFTFGVADTAAAGIRSIRLHSEGTAESDFGTIPTDNSVYYDLLRVTTGACAADPDRVGCWSFDEDAGTTAQDASGNANHGTYVGGPLLGVPGIAGTAVELDGADDHVVVPDAPSLDVGDAFTLEGWIRRDADGRTHQLFNKGGRGFHLVVMDRFNGNQVWLRKAGVTTIVRSAGGVPADGAFHHVVATKDGPGTARIYIDGAQQPLEPASPNQVIENTAFGLFFSATRSGNPVDGALDEYAVYARPLSQGEVQDRYAALRGGDAPPAPTAARTASGTEATATASGNRSCADAGRPDSGITAIQVTRLSCDSARDLALGGPRAVAAAGLECAIVDEQFGGRVVRIARTCTGDGGRRLRYTTVS